MTFAARMTRALELAALYRRAFGLKRIENAEHFAAWAAEREADHVG